MRASHPITGATLSAQPYNKEPFTDVRPVFAIGAAMVVTLFAWVVVLFFYRWTFDGNFSTKHDEWGQFGDYVGGLLNPLLGTLTLFGVLYTVRLQREVLKVSRDQLAEAARTERNQRLLNEQQGFETGFFQLLDAANQHARRSFVRLAPKDFEPPSDVSRQHADGVATHFTDENVFPSVIRAFRGRFLRAFERGDLPDRKRCEYLRSEAGPFFVNHDNGLGLFLRSMADLFEYVDDHDMRVAATIVGGGLPFGAQWPNPQIPNVQEADFYARVAANNRTRFEMKVFAMYVASDLVSANPQHCEKIFHFRSDC
jgi:hypothetical protein